METYRGTLPTQRIDGLGTTILGLLVTGSTQVGISRQLYISQRTVEVYAAQARRVLGASTPYTLGMLAVRHGYVDPVAVTDQALRNRDRPGWRGPTSRQAEILQLLASRHTYSQAASRLGVGTRTIRRELKRLASANGVCSLVTAGALFEALGWNRPCQ